MLTLFITHVFTYWRESEKDTWKEHTIKEKMRKYTKGGRDTKRVSAYERSN